VSAPRDPDLDDDAPTEEWIVDDRSLNQTATLAAANSAGPRRRASDRRAATFADDLRARIAALEEIVERAVRRALASKSHDTAVSSAGQRKEATCRDDETKKRGSSDPTGSRARSFGASRSSRRKPLARKIEELTAIIETRLMQSK
jgi:hypothetical protein